MIRGGRLGNQFDGVPRHVENFGFTMANLACFFYFYLSLLKKENVQHHKLSFGHGIRLYWTYYYSVSCTYLYHFL